MFRGVRSFRVSVIDFGTNPYVPYQLGNNLYSNRFKYTGHYIWIFSISHASSFVVFKGQGIVTSVILICVSFSARTGSRLVGETFFLMENVF